MKIKLDENLPTALAERLRGLGRPGHVPCECTAEDRIAESLCDLGYDVETVHREFLRADGELIGPKGRALSVVTIWLRWRLDGRVRFVTLKPRKETRK